MPLKKIIKSVSEPRMKHLGLPRGPIAIISKLRDCVVELVGLEPTTKVLWNMGRVRPTTLVGHLSRSSGVLLFCLIFLAF